MNTGRGWRALLVPIGLLSGCAPQSQSQRPVSEASSAPGATTQRTATDEAAAPSAAEPSWSPVGGCLKDGEFCVESDTVSPNCGLAGLIAVAVCPAAGRVGYCVADRGTSSMAVRNRTHYYRPAPTNRFAPEAGEQLRQLRARCDSDHGIFTAVR